MAVRGVIASGSSPRYREVQVRIVNVQFSFLGNFKHGPRQAFSQYWLHLSAFPLPSSIQAAWMGFPKRFPTHKSHISHRFKISPNLCYCRICVARTLLSLDKLVKKGGGKALVQRAGFGREL